MKLKPQSHSYDGITGRDCSEVEHMKGINDRMTKISHERFAKTPAEKAALKDATNAYVNKNHKPMNQLIIG